jgi:hypothetical protein
MGLGMPSAVPTPNLALGQCNRPLAGSPRPCWPPTCMTSNMRMSLADDSCQRRQVRWSTSSRSRRELGQIVLAPRRVGNATMAAAHTRVAPKCRARPDWRIAGRRLASGRRGRGPRGARSLAPRAPVAQRRPVFGQAGATGMFGPGKDASGHGRAYKSEPRAPGATGRRCRHSRPGGPESSSHHPATRTR